MSWEFNSGQWSWKENPYSRPPPWGPSIHFAVHCLNVTLLSVSFVSPAGKYVTDGETCAGTIKSDSDKQQVPERKLIGVILYLLSSSYTLTSFLSASFSMQLHRFVCVCTPAFGHLWLCVWDSRCWSRVFLRVNFTIISQGKGRGSLCYL